MANPSRWVLGALLAVAAVPAAAQAVRPRATVAPVVETVPVARGATAVVRLNVELPPDVHVQAHEPKDPLLIPTVLHVEVPAGVAVESVSYPEPAELPQAGRADPLLVLGPRFSIQLRLSIDPDAPAGDLVVPGVLRYQACNDTVCFPPSRASAEWRLQIADP